MQIKSALAPAYLWTEVDLAQMLRGNFLQRACRASIFGAADRAQRPEDSCGPFCSLHGEPE